MIYTRLIIALLLSPCLYSLGKANTRLDLLLAGRGLPNMDIFNGAPDAYAIVFYAPTFSDSYSTMGDTHIVNDNNNPDWNEVFNFFVYSTQHRIKVEVWDSDVDSDDFIGSVELNLSDIMNSSGNVYEKTLSPSGNGRIAFTKRINYTVAEAQFH